VVTKEKYKFIQAVIHKSLGDDLKKWNTGVWQDKGLFFSNRISSQQVSILMIPSLIVASCTSFVSVSSNILMSMTMTPIPTVNFQTITVLSVRSPSGSTAASSAICFRTSRKLWSVRSRWREFSNSKMSAAFYVQICMLNLDIMSGSTLHKRGLM
jgi:hypothetical protein